MARLLGLVMTAVLIFVGAEIYEKGPRVAFDGMFSFLSWGDDLPDKAVEHISTPKRVGAKVQASIDLGQERYHEFADD